MNRTVLITGAAGGIGRAMVAEFINLGDKVLAQDRSEKGLHLLCRDFENAPIRTVVSDLTVDHGLTEGLAKTLSPDEVVDVLAANAGGALAPTLEKTTPELWRRDIELNLHGTMRSIEAVKQGMIGRCRGNIIVTGSVNSLLFLGHPAYSAAKAALISYVKTLATEYGKFGIRANIILPGTVRTPVWQSRVEKNPELFEQLIKWYPLGRVVDPEDIAKAAVFLASDAAKSITGVALPVDCGLTAGNRLMAEDLTLEKI
jgi:NAD(P)-dependent dehydrogenase (short-subunit alcohol dehydrogenase family)